MKWALLCGASGDLGHQIAKDLVADGWSLYLHYYRNKTRVDDLVVELAKELSQAGFFNDPS